MNETHVVDKIEFKTSWDRVKENFDINVKVKFGVETSLDKLRKLKAYIKQNGIRYVEY